MTRSIVWVGLGSLSIFCAACGDDGSGGGGSGGGSVSNDPGRAVDGCFDCTDTEYCLVISGDTEEFHCADTDCASDCACMEEDAGSRLEICQGQFSCQEGGDIFYCYE